MSENGQGEMGRHSGDTGAAASEGPSLEKPSGGARPPWRWIIVTVLVALVALAAGIGITRCSRGDGAAGAAAGTETSRPVTTQAPTWNMTAQPVPNQYGSYGRLSFHDEAERFVQSYYSWEPDVQMPEWHLAMVRNWTTDPLFAQMVQEKQFPPEWKELQADVKTRKVSIVRSQQVPVMTAPDVSYMNVEYVLVDTHADGSETRSETKTVGLRLGPQTVELQKDTGMKQIKESRVMKIHDGPWTDEEARAER